jgi:hypothetical protein
MFFSLRTACSQGELSFTLAWLSFCLAGAATGCSADDSADPAKNEPGSPNLITTAYAALESAEYDKVSDLVADLDAAFEQTPTQGRLAFYAGTMRLWLATGGPREPGDVFNDVLGAIDKLEQARVLRPEDPHVNAFLGIAQVAFGNVLRDEQRIDTGRTVLVEGIPFYPPYVNGVRTQAMGMLPRDHQYFPQAIEAMYDTFAACGVQTSAGSDLRITYPSAADKPPGTCWNSGKVDHVWEGIFLIYGDVLVKSGDPGLGRQLYETAKQSPTFDAWPFGHELEARIAGIDERAALYLDGDGSNDPPTWMEQRNLCVGCHASKP